MKSPVLAIRMAFFWLLLLPAATHAETLILGVLAHRPKPEVITRWQPLADYLSDAIHGKHFRLLVLTFSEMNAALQNHELDFLLNNPAHYIELRKSYGLSGALATLTEEGGLTEEENIPLNVFGGVIFTLNSRMDISQIGDLNGKRIAFVSTSSLGGYQIQLLEMLHAGIPLPEPGNNNLSTGMPHDKVVNAVLAGQADIGFIRTGVIEHMAHEGKLDLSKLKIIESRKENNFPFALSTPLYAEWPFTALPHVDKQVARRVAAALLAIEDESVLATAIKLHGFSIPSDYSSVEKLMRELRLPPFDTLPHITLSDIWYKYRFAISIASFSILAIFFCSLD